MIVEMKIELFRNMVRLHEERIKWLNTVPIEIRSFLYNNPYAEGLHQEIEALITSIFNIVERNDISWFLYDWEEGREYCINGEWIVIKNLDQYCDIIRDLWMIESG